MGKVIGKNLTTETDKNVACPWCNKIIFPEEIDKLECKHCGYDLRVKFLKNLKTGEVYQKIIN